MSDHPFFEPERLTDEEILKKLSDLNQRLTVAHYTSTNYNMIGQLQGMIDALNNERMVRLARQTQEAWDKMFPDVIETEPDFKEERPDPTRDKAHVVKPAQGAKKKITAPVFHKEYVKKDSDKSKPQP